MHHVYYGLVFCLGAYFASFYYTFAGQLFTRAGVWTCRSKSTHYQPSFISWYYVPLVSFLIRSRRSPSLLFYQFLGGLFSLSLILQPTTQLTTFIFNFFLYHILFWMAVIDQHHMIIPDSLQVCLLALFLISHLATGQLFQVSYLLSAVGMFAIVYLCDLLVPDGLGGGDIKLLVTLSYGYGFERITLILFFASFIALVSMVIRHQVKKANIQNSIPFGPFIVISFLLVELFV